MVEWISQGRTVRQFRVIGQTLLVLMGLIVVLWRVDAVALPPVEGSSEQSRIVSKRLVKSPHARLARGEEALAHYARTGDRAALKEALDLVSAVSAHFSSEALKVRRDNGKGFDADDTIAFARFSNMMFRYTGQALLYRQAQDSLNFLKDEQQYLPGEAKRSVRQAEEELRSAPLHITVVGAKNDERAQQLWSEAVRVSDHYIRREWWDRREGVLPNPDVRYPQLVSPAAYVCIDTRCSVPLSTVQELRERLAQREIAKEE